MNDWPRVREIFETAVARPTAERLTYVAAACGDDAALRDQVGRLLEAHLRATSFLETPGAELLGVAAPTTRLEGLRVGSYFVSARIGSGGMGEVYLASDERLQRPVALKSLPVTQSHETGGVRRFLQTARAASALNHPNIVTIYEIMETAEGCFIAMELVEGQTLREIVGHRRAASDVLNVGRQCADALRVAHAAGIIHRDIKPENIMVRSDGCIKLLDFGLADLVRASPMLADAATEFHVPSGRISGTWRYMSPEQSRGEAIAAATDIFSLGLVLYELATGQHPFDGKSPASIWRAAPSYSPTSVSSVNPNIPAALDAVIFDMLERDPRLRPTSEAVARSLGDMLSITSRAAGLSGPSLRSARNTVGRELERAALRTAYESLGAERGAMISIAGEPGSGKTTLVEDFVMTLDRSKERCRIARGRCSERLAGTEVYLPWLEALDSLFHGKERQRTLDLTRTLAPTWYARVAPASHSGSASPGEMGAASPEHLKRELAVLLRELSRKQRLVLFFDDLHWADVSTVDLLSFIADRLDGFQILVLVAYRPSDLLLARHPFVQVKQGLQARGLCRELTLYGLSAGDIERYLAVEFPEHRFPRAFSARIHAKTEGNPLFMSDLVRYVRDRGIIAQHRGRWALTQPLDALDQGWPESLRRMIEIKIAQLNETDRKLLATAAVQGNEFDSAVLARVLSQSAEYVEERLNVLERIYAFLTLVDERQFPDHTLTSRYRFIHVLYQNALYASIEPTRKAQLAAALGQTLESLWGSQTAEVANQLAVLFETAGEYSRAADYYRLAAMRAGELLASREQETLARRGLTVADCLPAGPERLSKELSLRLVLGNALIATSGYAAPEVENAFLRAGELCRQLGDTPRLLPVHYGLSAFHLVKGQARRGLTIGREFLDLAERHNDPAVIVGHRLLGIMSFCLGELPAAREHLARASAMYDAAAHRSLTLLYGGEPEMSACSYLGMTLWLLGYPDQALDAHDKALGLGREILHAQSRAHTLAFGAAQHQCRHDWRRVNTLIEEMLALTADQGLRLWHAYGSAMRGWVLTAQGDIEEGIDEIRTGLDRLQGFGAQHFQPYFLCLLAEAHLDNGQPNTSLEILDRAHGMIEATEERFWEPEAWRLRGEIFASARVRKAAEAERHFLEAIDIARRQQARSLELRAAISLSRLLMQQGRRPEAHAILKPIHNWFTEGLSTFDLIAASTVLKQLI